MKELTTVAFADVSIVARYRGPTAPDIVEEQCYDISKGGMFVRSFKPLPSGTLIKFECRVDDNPNDIQGIGRVVWRRDEDCPEAPSGMGVKFLVLRPGSPEIIDRVIRKAGPMPKLFESENEAGQQREQTRAQQRTSYRARTMVGNQADKLAVEVKRNRSAKREQSILTAKNAQKLVTEAKLEEAKKTRTQNLSQIRAAPVIAITQEDKPQDKSTANAATAQQQETQNQTVTVQAGAQDEGQQNRTDEIRGEVKTTEDNTARALRLAAQRAKQLAEREATITNLEVAAESTMKTENRRGAFWVKSLVFASMIGVILLRVGYTMYGSSENENRVDRHDSVGATAPSAATQGEIEQSASQQTATRALGFDQPAVETIAETRRPAGDTIESTEQNALKTGTQAFPIESDRAIKPKELRAVRASAPKEKRERRKSQFERAAACQKRGDYDCVIRLLADKVNSEEERLLLAKAYRSIKGKRRVLRKSNKYERIVSPAESWEEPVNKSVFRKTTSGIPDNPYPE